MALPRFTSSTKPLDRIEGLRPMSREDEQFWRLRRERKAKQEESPDNGR